LLARPGSSSRRPGRPGRAGAAPGPSARLQRGNSPFLCKQKRTQRRQERERLSSGKNMSASHQTLEVPDQCERVLPGLARGGALSSSAPATRQQSRLASHLIPEISMESTPPPSVFSDDSDSTTESAYSDSEGSSRSGSFGQAEPYWLDWPDVNSNSHSNRENHNEAYSSAIERASQWFRRPLSERLLMQSSLPRSCRPLSRFRFNRAIANASDCQRRLMRYSVTSQPTV